jgi:hypothetical protein
MPAAAGARKDRKRLACRCYQSDKFRPRALKKGLTVYCEHIIIQDKLPEKGNVHND